MELDQQIDALEYKLTHNELSIEETDKMKEEVKHYRQEKIIIEQELESVKIRVGEALKNDIRKLREAYIRTHTYIN